MKRLILGIVILLIIQIGHAQGVLVEPNMQVPDSLVGRFDGNIALMYFVDSGGRIINWQLRAIHTWNKRKNEPETIYSEKH